MSPGQCKASLAESIAYPEKDSDLTSMIFKTLSGTEDAYSL